MLLFVLACTASESVDSIGKTNDTADSGAGSHPTTDLAVGGIAEVDGASGEVTVTVANAGTYILALVSLAEDQGASFGYGASADAAVRRTPPDPVPALPPRRAPPMAAANVGDERTFTVYDGSAWQTITAKATAVSDTAVLWEDQTTPNEIGTVDEATVEGVLTALSGIVLPRERANFGAESDVDTDGKLAILLSYTVNQYGAVAYVSQCDIGHSAGCGNAGNDAEVVYVGIPDPDDKYGTVAGITETVAHELNHLIYGWHRFVGPGRGNASENIYITEGMSALAQDLTGYNNGNQYVWAAALDATDALGPYASTDSVSVNDFLRGDGYYDTDRDGTLRGASYLFLRYLFEQAGGISVDAVGSQTDAGGMGFLHAWFDADPLGADTVEAASGIPLETAILDWYTALVCTGLVETGDSRYAYQDRVEDPLTGYSYGVNPYDTIHGWLELHGPPIQDLAEADGSLRAGGVEYLRVDLAAGETLSVPVAAEALAKGRLIRAE